MTDTILKISKDKKVIYSTLHEVCECGCDIYPYEPYVDSEGTDWCLNCAKANGDVNDVVSNKIAPLTLRLEELRDNFGRQLDIEARKEVMMFQSLNK